MDRVFTHGKMAGNMMVIINKTKSMDLVFTIGQMEESMKGNGQVESNMEKGFIHHLIRG